MKKKSIMLLVLIIILTIITIGIFIYKRTITLQNSTSRINGVAFEINNIDTNPNEEITISIKMLNDSNFVAANFELLYDSSKMDYINYEKGEILEKGAMSIVNNDNKNSKVLIAYVGNPQNKVDVVHKGDLINITFKLKESINNMKITPELKCTTLKQRDGKDVQNFIKQGTISIKK